MQINSRLFKIAYKKLKSSVYFDKSQTILRDELVAFESRKKDIDDYLEEFALDYLNAEKRTEIEDDILDSISYYAFPKSFISDSDDMIKNFSSKEIEVDKNQYFIKMNIQGHILGVLWILLIGYRLDKQMYDFSYGNRIRKNLNNELSEEPTFSPYLFEPYFQQYEGWRDNAMDQALSYLHAGHDIAVITLDFQRFYYSVDISRKFMDEIYESVVEEIDEDEDGVLKALNDLMYGIIRKYASKFKEFDKRRILPIGFLPSNVLANFALRNFDQAILDGWNPVYFGRYVDDVLIVDKIENNSDLFKRANKNSLRAKDIIQYFLAQCSGWRGLNGIKCEQGKSYALFELDDSANNSNDIKSEEADGDKQLYVLNKLYNPRKNDKSKIVVQNDKVRIFYFQSKESDALITCFRETIAKNKSEFRHMPEDEAIFQKDDYSQIYDLNNDETLNKFRGVTGISINKFELSKLLGKYLRIGGLINDIKETKFENQLDKIFNNRVIIENYSVWEKVIEILVINESFTALKKFIDSIVDAINSLTYKSKRILRREQKTLFLHLHAALNRSLALVWGEDIEQYIVNLYNNDLVGIEQLGHISIKEINKKRKAYCKTRMVDKSVMPVFIDMLQMNKIYLSDEKTNLTDFGQVMKRVKKEWNSQYNYYPFLVTMYDFSMIECITELGKREGAFAEPQNMYENQVQNYVKSNYNVPGYINKVKQFIQIDPFNTKKLPGKPTFLISVGNEKKDKLKIAIANVRLKHDNFEGVVKDNPNRSYERYKDVSKIINEAIDEHADMLIMPEAFIPFEWLATIARTCSRNNLAVVTGVEHIKHMKKIYNLTAVILPYDDFMNKSAYISFHLKTHYAPSEKREINGYRLKAVEGGQYELYKWANCYFPVYCCYELTSITERAIFQSYADFLIAIEWNKDVNYYSNILESLSRDIHCYCVQVNSSDYGDSRITKPSKTEDKDILRTKGGINSTILVDEINIKEMRNFQIKEYELQTSDDRFKSTPPGFKPNIVMKKIKGEKLV